MACFFDLPGKADLSGSKETDSSMDTVTPGSRDEEDEEDIIIVFEKTSKTRTQEPTGYITVSSPSDHGEKTDDDDCSIITKIEQKDEKDFFSMPKTESELDVDNPQDQSKGNLPKGISVKKAIEEDKVEEVRPVFTLPEIDEDIFIIKNPKQKSADIEAVRKTLSEVNFLNNMHKCLRKTTKKKKVSATKSADSTIETSSTTMKSSEEIASTSNKVTDTVAANKTSKRCLPSRNHLLLSGKQLAALNFPEYIPTKKRRYVTLRKSSEKLTPDKIDSEVLMSTHCVLRHLHKQSTNCAHGAEQVLSSLNLLLKARNMPHKIKEKKDTHTKEQLGSCYKEGSSEKQIITAYLNSLLKEFSHPTESQQKCNYSFNHCKFRVACFRKALQWLSEKTHPDLKPDLLMNLKNTINGLEVTTKHLDSLQKQDGDNFCSVDDAVQFPSDFEPSLDLELSNSVKEYAEMSMLTENVKSSVTEVGPYLFLAKIYALWNSQSRISPNAEKLSANQNVSVCNGNNTKLAVDVTDHPSIEPKPPESFFNYESITDDYDISDNDANTSSSDENDRLVISPLSENSESLVSSKECASDTNKSLVEETSHPLLPESSTKTETYKHTVLNILRSSGSSANSALSREERMKQADQVLQCNKESKEAQKTSVSASAGSSVTNVLLSREEGVKCADQVLPCNKEPKEAQKTSVSASAGSSVTNVLLSREEGVKCADQVLPCNKEPKEAQKTSVSASAGSSVTNVLLSREEGVKCADQVLPCNKESKEAQKTSVSVSDRFSVSNILLSREEGVKRADQVLPCNKEPKEAQKTSVSVSDRFSVSNILLSREEGVKRADQVLPCNKESKEAQKTSVSVSDRFSVSNILLSREEGVKRADQVLPCNKEPKEAQKTSVSASAGSSVTNVLLSQEEGVKRADQVLPCNKESKEAQKTSVSVSDRFSVSNILLTREEGVKRADQVLPCNKESKEAQKTSVSVSDRFSVSNILLSREEGVKRADQVLPCNKEPKEAQKTSVSVSDRFSVSNILLSREEGVKRADQVLPCNKEPKEAQKTSVSVSDRFSVSNILLSREEGVKRADQVLPCNKEPKEAQKTSVSASAGSSVTNVLLSREEGVKRADQVLPCNKEPKEAQKTSVSASAGSSVTNVLLSREEGVKRADQVLPCNKESKEAQKTSVSTSAGSSVNSLLAKMLLSQEEGVKQADKVLPCSNAETKEAQKTFFSISAPANTGETTAKETTLSGKNSSLSQPPYKNRSSKRSQRKQSLWRITMPSDEVEDDKPSPAVRQTRSQAMKKTNESLKMKIQKVRETISTKDPCPPHVERNSRKRKRKSLDVKGSQNSVFNSATDSTGPSVQQAPLIPHLWRKPIVANKTTGSQDCQEKTIIKENQVIPEQINDMNNLNAQSESGTQQTVHPPVKTNEIQIPNNGLAEHKPGAFNNSSKADKIDDNVGNLSSNATLAPMNLVHTLCAPTAAGKTDTFKHSPSNLETAIPNGALPGNFPCLPLSPFGKQKPVKRASRGSRVKSAQKLDKPPCPQRVLNTSISNHTLMQQRGGNPASDHGVYLASSNLNNFSFLPQSGRYAQDMVRSADRIEGLQIPNKGLCEQVQDAFNRRKVHDMRGSSEAENTVGNVENLRNLPSNGSLVPLNLFPVLYQGQSYDKCAPRATPDKTGASKHSPANLGTAISNSALSAYFPPPPIGIESPGMWTSGPGVERSNIGRKMDEKLKNCTFMPGRSDDAPYRIHGIQIPCNSMLQQVSGAVIPGRSGGTPQRNDGIPVPCNGMGQQVSDAVIPGRSGGTPHRNDGIPVPYNGVVQQGAVMPRISGVIPHRIDGKQNPYNGAIQQRSGAVMPGRSGIIPHRIDGTEVPYGMTQQVSTAVKRRKTHTGLSEAEKVVRNVGNLSSDGIRMTANWNNLAVNAGQRHDLRVPTAPLPLQSFEMERAEVHPSRRCGARNVRKIDQLPHIGNRMDEMVNNRTVMPGSSGGFTIPSNGREMCVPTAPGSAHPPCLRNRHNAIHNTAMPGNGGGVIISPQNGEINEMYAPRAPNMLVPQNYFHGNGEQALLNPFTPEHHNNHINLFLVHCHLNSQEQMPNYYQETNNKPTWNIQLK